jgi:predicted dehydrogenase
VTRQVRVGLIGCGLIAQVQHLPNLRSLPALFEVVAIADRDQRRARQCAKRFAVGKVHDDGDALLDEDIEAVIIATSGDHAQLVAAAARKSLAVLVEKPLCLDLATAGSLVRTLGPSHRRVMLGYMRRYDETFRGVENFAHAGSGPLLVRTRTAETAAGAYLKALPIDEELKADEDPLRTAGDEYSHLGTRIGGTARQARLYKNIVLDSLVHELNMVQALLGKAESAVFADLSGSGASAVLRCEQGLAQLAWVATPGSARYAQEVEVLGAGGRALVRFDSPYLPGTAGRLTVEGGGPGVSEAWEKNAGPDVVGAFYRELLAFHLMVTRDEAPRTNLLEAVTDIAACEALGRAAVAGREVVLDDVAAGGPADGLARKDAGLQREDTHTGMSVRERKWHEHQAPE